MDVIKSEKLLNSEMSHISALHFATTYKWVRLYRKDNRWFISNKMRSIYVRKVSNASGRRGNKKKKRKKERLRCK